MEEIMAAALKTLLLPALFALPWLWLKISNGETVIRGLLANKPEWAGVALIPGAFLLVVWIFKQFKR
jgi:hypothetical protein